MGSMWPTNFDTVNLVHEDSNADEAHLGHDPPYFKNLGMDKKSRDELHMGNSH